MWALFADFLVGEYASEDARHGQRLRERLQSLVHRVDQRDEELDGVVLLPQVHRLALQPGKHIQRGVNISLPLRRLPLM